MNDRMSDMDALVEKAAAAYFESAPEGCSGYEFVSERIKDRARPRITAALLAVGLPALLERVEAAEQETRECQSCAPSQEATWVRLVESIEAERDELRGRLEAAETELVRLADAAIRGAKPFAQKGALLAAKVADAQRLLEQWRYESLAGHRFGASVDELQDLRAALDASETP